MRNAAGLIGALALCGLHCAPAAEAQSYPSRPIRLIVPATPGASTDTLARVVGIRLGEALGQQVITDNRPGAGSILGTDLVAKAPPDGYTVGVIYTAHTTNASLQAKLPYDPIRDFAPVTMLTAAPLVLVVNPASGLSTVKVLIALARTKPLAYGSAGVGSGGHLSGELFRIQTGTQLIHVPYKGAAPAATDVAGGHLAFQFASQITVQPFLSSNRLRAIAVTSAKRAGSLPDVPTVAESGVPGFEVLNWFGIVAPARTHAPVVDRLHAEIVKVLKLPDVREKLAAEGSDIVGSSPREFGAFIAADIAKWAKVVKEAGIKGE